MVRFLISITKEMRDALKSVANQRGQTLCGLIRQILWEWLDGRQQAKERGRMSARCRR